MRHFYVFLFLFLWAGGYNRSYAQNQDQALIDSLLQELPKTKEDTNKVKLLGDLSFNYRYIKQDEGIKYGQQELELATRLKWKKGIAKAYNSLGNNYDIRSDHPKAIEYFQKSLKLYEETGDKINIGETNLSIAHVYEQQSDFPKALEYYFKSLIIYEGTGDKNKTAVVNGSIGVIFNEEGNYSNAIEFYQKAIRLEMEIDDKFNIAINEGNIGNVYFNQNDFPKALEYHFKSLKIYQELWQKNSVAYEYQIIGNIYMEMKYYLIAIHYEQMSLKISEETGNKVLEGYILAAIGNAYVALVKDADNTKRVKEPGEKIAEKYKGKISIPVSKTARLRLAIDYLQQGVAIGLKMQLYQLTQYCYETLADAYKLSGNFKKAIEYTNNYHVLTDSFFSKKNKEKIVMLEMKNQYDHQHLEDSVKTVKQEKIAAIALNRQRSYLWIAISFSMFVLVIIALIYFNYTRVRGLHKKVSIQKTELEKKNRDNERILQIVAHDLRSPIGSIAYISDLMMMGNRTKKEVFDSLTTIKNASLGSLELINELASQNENTESPNKKLVDIGLIITECATMLNFKAKEKQQTIITNIPPAPIYILVNREKISRVINNLVGNAIKFSHAKQVIEITLEQDDANVLIKIKDNGIGIPENIKQEVFDIFTDSKRYGTLGEKPFGLGLYISRQIVEANGGTITFESREGEETIFYIRLPKKTA